MSIRYKLFCAFSVVIALACGLAWYGIRGIATSGDLVVRLYEAHGDRSTATVTTSIDWEAVETTDLLERPVDTAAIVDVSPRRIELDLRPFELLTLRFRAPRAAE